MTRTTRAQRQALMRLFDRREGVARDQTYREFRESVQPELCGGGAVLVRWYGMWLGIEPDGYTHS